MSTLTSREKFVQQVLQKSEATSHPLSLCSRVSESQMDVVRVTAKKYGLSTSELIRRLIDNMEDILNG